MGERSFASFSYSHFSIDSSCFLRTAPRHHGLRSTQRRSRSIQSPLCISIQDHSPKLSIYSPPPNLPPAIPPQLCLLEHEILLRPPHRCRSSRSRRRSRLLLLQPRQRQLAVRLLRRDEGTLHAQVRGLPEGV